MFFSTQNLFSNRLQSILPSTPSGLNPTDATEMLNAILPSRLQKIQKCFLAPQRECFLIPVAL